MEYPYYAEQTYMYTGYVEARILTAQEAEILGYEDGYVDSRDNCKVYVDGFSDAGAIGEYVVNVHFTGG